jgi:hypothetical protein
MVQFWFGIFPISGTVISQVISLCRNFSSRVISTLIALLWWLGRKYVCVNVKVVWVYLISRPGTRASWLNSCWIFTLKQTPFDFMDPSLLLEWLLYLGGSLSQNLFSSVEIHHFLKRWIDHFLKRWIGWVLTRKLLPLQRWALPTKCLWYPKNMFIR